MATVDGILIGFLMGSFMVGGVWAFVEADRRSTPSYEFVPTRHEHAVPAPRPSARDAARPADPPTVEWRRPRRSTWQPVIATELAPLVWSGPAVAMAPRLEAPGRDSSEPEQAPAITAPTTRARSPIAVAVGSGVETSLSPTLGNAAQWNLRVMLEPREHLGLELGYAGTSSARLTASSVEALATWYPQSRRAGRYYVFGGIGWRHFQAPLKLDAAILPVGAGLTYARGHWRADTRVTLRLADRRALHTLATSASVGRMF